jgi:hypothetical protein
VLHFSPVWTEHRLHVAFPLPFRAVACSLPCLKSYFILSIFFASLSFISLDSVMAFICAHLLWISLSPPQLHLGLAWTSFFPNCSFFALGIPATYSGAGISSFFDSCLGAIHGAIFSGCFLIMTYLLCAFAFDLTRIVRSCQAFRSRLRRVSSLRFLHGRLSFQLFFRVPISWW